MKLKQLVCCLCFTLTAPAAMSGIIPIPVDSSNLIASDDFEYVVNGLKNNNGGTGWKGSWTALDTTKVVGVNNMSGETAIQITDNGPMVAYRELQTAFSGTTLYIDFLFQLSRGTLALSDIIAFWLSDTTDRTPSSLPNIGIFADGVGNNDVFARTLLPNQAPFGAWVNNSDIGTTANITYNIVGRLSKVGDSNYYNQFEVWLNPTLDDLLKGSNAAKFVGVSSLTEVSWVGIRTLNLDSDPQDTVLIDNLRLYTAPGQRPIPNPEPATLALMGLGLMGLAWARRSAVA